jgi:hypothetical protein
MAKMKEKKPWSAAEDSRIPIGLIPYFPYMGKYVTVDITWITRRKVKGNTVQQFHTVRYKGIWSEVMKKYHAKEKWILALKSLYSINFNFKISWIPEVTKKRKRTAVKLTF